MQQSKMPVIREGVLFFYPPGCIYHNGGQNILFADNICENAANHSIMINKCCWDSFDDGINISDNIIRNGSQVGNAIDNGSYTSYPIALDKGTNNIQTKANIVNKFTLLNSALPLANGESSGMAVIPSGSAFIDVSHGLGVCACIRSSRNIWVYCAVK